MKYYHNDVQMDEEEYFKILKEHEEWILEEEKRVEAMWASEKKLQDKKDRKKKC
jgi:hypothetical protein